MTGIYIITGTSRGIGKAVAEHLLKTGNRVYGISRSPSPIAGSPGFHQALGSMTDPELIESVFREVKDALAHERFDFLCLLSNAAVLDPLGAIETCAVGDIERHIQVNLAAPIMLTARFMALFADAVLRKKVVHMTSGAARTPIPDASLYCATKAGISMFCECVGAEQYGRQHGFEIAAISPGMVETDMQKTMRSKSAAEFRPSDRFRAARESGAVQDLETVARRIADILEAKTNMGQTVSVPDWTN